MKFLPCHEESAVLGISHVFFPTHLPKFVVFVLSFGFFFGKGEGCVEARVASMCIVFCSVQSSVLAWTIPQLSDSNDVQLTFQIIF